MKSVTLMLLALAAACGGSPKRAPISATELSSSAAPAVVTISAGASKRGTGFVVDASGLIATTLNVVEGESRIQITLSDGSTVYPVTAIAGVDAGHGLALLRVTPAVALPTVRLGDSGSVSAGARVYGLGPAGASEGAIRQVRRLSPDLTILELPAAEPQTWTGPVFDETGDVIGVSAAYVQPQGIVVVVPVNYIKRLMQQQVSLSPDEFARQTAYSAPQL